MGNMPDDKKNTFPRPKDRMIQSQETLPSLGKGSGSGVTLPDDKKLPVPVRVPVKQLMLREFIRFVEAVFSRKSNKMEKIRSHKEPISEDLHGNRNNSGQGAQDLSEAKSNSAAKERISERGKLKREKDIRLSRKRRLLNKSEETLQPLPTWLPLDKSEETLQPPLDKSEETLQPLDNSEVTLQPLNDSEEERAKRAETAAAKSIQVVASCFTTMGLLLCWSAIIGGRPLLQLQGPYSLMCAITSMFSFIVFVCAFLLMKLVGEGDFHVEIFRFKRLLIIAMALVFLSSHFRHPSGSVA